MLRRLEAERKAKASARSKRATTPLLVRLAIIFLIQLVGTALLADFLTPYDPVAIDLRARLAPPVGFGGLFAHPLGTDELGRDMLSRLILSIRMSVSIAMGATLLGAALGTALGFLAAHFRGWVEHAILALADFQATMPFLILALAVLAFVGNALQIFICLLALHGWERYARIARGLAISANAQGYAGAVRQLGAHPLRVYWRHILPNVAASLIVSMTISFPEIILVESGLSFLGLGVQPPATSLGAMVGYGRDYLTRAPWILVAPSLVISLMALSVSLVGDWLRDRLDIELR
ncbi:ABC transporter permease [Mesorhizobium delmotii]|uniref:ABC transporter, permease protein n=1 Tax=Mesorhizobium delmotii TaxID=1631247 RepID=A0A2P9AN70_9HYPH|nr:ABC transporter permease [Mesorhizobium delmotii]SJM32507.1 ABC transporter, permease protein [Mesorhizobium delmotii]